jgi:hypothetical protein
MQAVGCPTLRGVQAVGLPALEAVNLFYGRETNLDKNL